MKKFSALFLLCPAVIFFFGGKRVSAQIQFANFNHIAASTTHSGCAVTVADVNNDGLDDLVKMDQSTNLMVDLQNQDGSFTNYNLGNITGTSRVWGMAVADVDNNGWKDVVTGRNGACFLVKLSWNGSTIVTTNTPLAGSYFVQNITLGDFNNDGWTDLFVCDDNDYGKIYINDGAGNLPLLDMSFSTLTLATGPQSLTVGTGKSYLPGQSLTIGFDGHNYMTGAVTNYNAGTGALDMNITTVTGSGTYDSWSVDASVIFNININGSLAVGGDPYDSGNYGSVWSDFDNDGDLDLYIAHCRQSASSTSDVRRRDRLFVNDGQGRFTEDAQSYGVEVSTFLQTWTTSFGDLDNDGDMDIVMTNHGVNGQILQNDGTGHYTDVTLASGFSTTVNGGMDPIESAVEDFDNDGFLDILVSGGGSGDSYVLYHNNGDGTFTLMSAPIPAAGHGMLSFATGDLNHDGRTDLFASYGNVYNTPTTTADVLYLNTTENTNHFITFMLTGTASNIDAIGARVSVYGPWGVQVREVRAGESYGTANSMQLHFGLGQHSAVDSAVVDWPSGLHTVTGSLAADQFVTMVENNCMISGNIIPGPFVFCTGQSVTLTAASGFSSYLWSNGSPSQSLVVATSDTFNVMVTDGSGCTNISPSVFTRQNPDQTPIVTASVSDLNICQGDTLTLTSSPSASYLWSNGDTTQSTTVTQSGIYSVTIQGDCASFTSADDTVSVFPAPPPTVNPIVLPAPGPATLNATGNDITWYATASGGSPIGSGPSYTTGLLTSDTTFYAEDRYSYGGATDSTGLLFHSGTAYSANNLNDYQLFDVYQPCVLQSVKVYTDSAGLRLIELRDNANTLLQSALVNIPLDTSVVLLNFPLSPGTGYRLGTNATQNQSSFGYISPRLRRNSSGVSYPYTISNLLSITSSDRGNGFYYYFYNWVVELPPTVCVSDRVPVFVNVITGIRDPLESAGIRLYPNPSGGVLHVAFGTAQPVATVLRITDLAGRTLSRYDYAGLAAGETVTVDQSRLAAGTYLLQVESGGQATTHRFSVVH
jgi:hypothetical protein